MDAIIAQRHESLKRKREERPYIVDVYYKRYRRLEGLTPEAMQAYNVTLDIKHQLGEVSDIVNEVAAWKDLSTPLYGFGDETPRRWLDDYNSNAFRPGHNHAFTKIVETDLCIKYGAEIVDLLLFNFFEDHRGKHVLDLAYSLKNRASEDEIIAICLWAITARQLNGLSQQEHTRVAVYHVILIILAFKWKQPFWYDDHVRYEFGTIDEKAPRKRGPSFDMTYVAEYWFGVTLPNFVRDPEKDAKKLAEFRALFN